MDAITPNNADEVVVTKPLTEQVAPIYDENGKLTREGMERVIKSGGSVMYGHRLITSIEDLPSEGQLVKGDQARMAALRARLEADRQRIDAEIATLGADEASRKADVHRGALPFPTMTDPGPGAPDLRRGVLGEGDTAGLDGDASLAYTAAAAKAAEEQKAAEEATAAKEAEVAEATERRQSLREAADADAEKARKAAARAERADK